MDPRRIARKRWSILLFLTERSGRRVEFEFEDFEAIVSRPCAYCGNPLTKTGHGLDRKDSTLDYLRANVAPCCGSCNSIKGRWLTPDDMAAIRATLLRARAAWDEQVARGGRGGRPKNSGQGNSEIFSDVAVQGLASP